MSFLCSLTLNLWLELGIVIDNIPVITNSAGASRVIGMAMMPLPSVSTTAQLMMPDHISRS
jgi:hypothetical protein